MHDGRYPMVQTCAALTVIFLATNKVCSPQATLWVLPFFVVLNVRIRWWVLFSAADAIAWFAFLRTWHGPSFGVFNGSTTQISVAVMVRFVVLLVLVPVFFRAREARVDATADDAFVAAPTQPVASQRAAFV
jgi:hypothetical protein